MKPLPSALACRRKAGLLTRSFRTAARDPEVPGAGGASTDARGPETASALADGTDQAFLGDVGDKYAVLKEAAGR
jgi:hypothetical protein